jgi:hypothetical protein
MEAGSYLRALSSSLMAANFVPSFVSYPWSGTVALTRQRPRVVLISQRGREASHQDCYFPGGIHGQDV